jgi:ADP-heptose:LPS heptosyltransferase
VKILLLQLKRIGDLILTTPAIHCLREAYPEAHLTLAVDAACQGLLEAVPVDEFWVHQKEAGWGAVFGRGPNAWMRREVPGFRGDVCIDFTGTDRSAWLAFSSGCQKKITFARFQNKFLRRFIYTDFVDSSVRERHTADHYTDLLRPLDIARDRVPLDLRLPEQAARQARVLLDEAGVRAPFTVIHAGTARAEKYWLPQRWAEVAAELAADGRQVVLTGSADAVEQTHLQAIKSTLARPCVDLSGKTNLVELAAIVSEAALFCGVDTAAMHLADAAGIPIVALFGPTNPFHWRPRNANAIILRSGTKEPFTPGQKGGPMEAIPVESVLEVVRKILRDSAS